MKERQFEVKPNRLYEKTETTKVRKGDIVLAEVYSYCEGVIKLQVNDRPARMHIKDYNAYEQSENKAIKELISRIGQRIIARVKGFEGETIILERNSIVYETLSELTKKQGEIITATVENFAPYGLFCDIGNGVISLLHITEISKNRYIDLRNVFEEGEAIKVKILNKDISKNFFTISRKQAYEQIQPENNSFVQVICSYSLADESGIFVELNPATNGILDIPEQMSLFDFKEGKKVIAVIKSSSEKGFRSNFHHFV